MDYLWQQRHRVSDLVGTVINIHNGDWVRRGKLDFSILVFKFFIFFIYSFCFLVYNNLK